MRNCRLFFTSQFLVVDRTLSLAELRLNFLPMLSQFGFPQRMSELSKFGSTIFCHFFANFCHQWSTIIEVSLLFWFTFVIFVNEHRDTHLINCMHWSSEFEEFNSLIHSQPRFTAQISLFHELYSSNIHWMNTSTHWSN